MKILLVTPAPRHSLKGNRITAERWEAFLHRLGHEVLVEERFDGQAADVLIALHARKSAPSIRQFRAAHREHPIVLALTGTDLYRDIQESAEARESLEVADRLVVLQADAVGHLPEHLRPKARVIYQSVQVNIPAVGPQSDVFEVCVVGHLREVKDPFRTAEAARLLPASSRLQISHVGGVLEDQMRNRARTEQESNPRYHWLGELSREETFRVIARSRLLVLTSQLEGGANVIGEAVMLGTPVLSTRISGSIGLLGEDYPGFFPVGDTAALAALLKRAEVEEAFYAELTSRSAERRPLFEPEREQAAWRDLLAELE